jgi:hypothetical protein
VGVIFYNIMADRAGKAGLDWENADIRLLLLTAGYTPDVDDQYKSDISALAIQTEIALTGRTWTNGYARANNILLQDYTGSPIVAAVIYEFNTADADSPLWVYMDEGDGLPVAPDGSNFLIQWPTSGIFLY